MFFLFSQQFKCMQSVFDACQSFVQLNNFFPFKCQMLDMVEKKIILQNTPPPPLQKK